MMDAAGTATGDRRTVRTTISFSADVHDVLQRIAKQKRVSLAWVVRDAVETYINDRSPLLPRTGMRK